MVKRTGSTGNITRRSGLKALAGGLGALAMPFVDRRGATARADDAKTVRMMAGATAALKDWSVFEKETGLKMEFVPFHTDDVGALYNEVLNNDAGDRVDIINTLAGAQKNLIKRGVVAEIDINRLGNYAGISETVRESPLLYSAGGKHWTLPLYYNADSFGYFPKEVDKPRPPSPLTWDLVLNDESTRGRTAIEGDLIGLMIGGMYVKSRGLAAISDPANMTKAECTAATDWLIERKKAGQFRSFWKNYDEQVSNFVNKEVVAQQCWEPAVKDAREAGIDVEYAYCNDFYFLWMQAMFMPIQVTQRENIENVYKTLNWFMGGSYAANLAIQRGYNSARMDLGLEYAKAAGWSAEDVNKLSLNVEKVKAKFKNGNFWVGGAPDDLAAHEEQLARLRNA
jgi:spermidine/putrescine-binding protein